MKRALVLFAVFLVLSTVLPGSAFAGGSFHGGHHGHGGGWWWPGAIIGGLALTAVAVATAPLWALGAVVAPAVAEPPVVYQPPAYVAPTYAPPVAYVAPAVYPVPPANSAPPAYSAPTPQRYAAAPAVNREVVHPNGKYVLYGDGVQQPWQWVWVPAAAPPPPPPPRR